jgi:hypothetical protein
MIQRILSAFALLAIATVSLAQVPAGGEFRVNGYTTDPQMEPAVAVDGHGNFMVVWRSLLQDGSTWGVFGQRYDAAGAPRGAELQVNTYTTNEQSFPAVACGVDGRCVVVWHSYLQDGTSFGVYAQRYDAAGSPLGGEFRVSTETASNESGPAVAVDASGAFVVTWNAYADGSMDAFAQRFDAAGTRRGGQFRVNSYTTNQQQQAVVASDAAGNFVVAWISRDQDGSQYGIFAQRYDSSGAPRGGEFRVNEYTTSWQQQPAVAADAAGRFVVAWYSDGQDGSYGSVFARRYDASGAPQGAEFPVNTSTAQSQFWPSVSQDPHGGFVVTWVSDGQDGSGFGVFAQRYDSAGQPLGGELLVNTHTPSSQTNPVVAADDVGNFVVAWVSEGGQDGSQEGVFGQRFGGLRPSGLLVDVVPALADGNGVLEPGESAEVVPSWRNVNGAAQAFGGAGLGFTGPSASGVSYTLQDSAADYGTVSNGATAGCSDCYQVQVGFSGTRPSLHWDATFTERLTPDAQGQTKAWAVHVGDSFTDVPRTSAYYRFVEGLLHHGITGGCGADVYCPSSSTTREQMAVFVLAAKDGAGQLPAACSPPNTFNDVPETSPYCRFVEELAARGVVGGCAPSLYCPTSPVTREQMSVFALKTLDPTLDPPACGTPVFADVPASSPFCRWIEELARRGVVSGCGGGNYCPTDPVTREQMGVFISATFGLSLYGP